MSRCLGWPAWLDRLVPSNPVLSTFEQQLCLQMPDYKRKLDAGLVQAELRRFHKDQDLQRLWNQRPAQPFWSGYFKSLIQRDVQQLEALAQLYQRYRGRYQAALSPQEAQQHLLDFARALGAGGKQLRGDRRAFSREFGFDALLERYQKCCAVVQRRLIFTLERLGCLLASELAPLPPAERARYWKSEGLESLLLPLCEEPHGEALRAEAVHCLRQLLDAFSQSERPVVASDLTLKVLVRLAMDDRSALWVQVAALRALIRVNPQQGLSLSERWIREGADVGTECAEERIFLRYELCALLAPLQSGPQRCSAAGAEQAYPVDVSASRLSRDSAALLEQLAGDSSPYVRQGVARQLPHLSWPLASGLLKRLIAKGEPEAVRASALLSLQRLLTLERSFELLPLLCGALAPEQPPYIQRVALHVGVSAQLQLLEQSHQDAADAWQRSLEPLLTRLHQEAPMLEVRRWASRAREHLWAGADPRRRHWCQRVTEQLRATRWGRGLHLPRPADPEAADEQLRLLGVIADGDFGLDVEPGRRRWFIRRGDRFGLRLWRWLHEWRNPDTDKRQGFVHTLARKSRGLLQIQSPLLAELSETKVPGEPLHFASEDGWRPYLPLPDQLFAALDQGWPTRPLKLYSSEGITEVNPPTGFWGRLRARTLLSWRFADFARLRNWHEGQAESPTAYLEALQTLGFRFQLRTFTDCDRRPYPADPSVSRFFPVIGLPLFSEWWLRFEDYFFSPYQNSLRHLGWFMAALGSFFIGRHLFQSLQIRRLRRQLPLVIGGWGTRGKSGTERLKAALFNALGYPLVSKTTGCEAMFLHGPAFGELKELFLFRPYDKATIWEQVDVMRHARALGAKVFLWECMGLTPSYVKILQRQWMRDDIATITNTYPDHENLQGPAGINIPQVMTDFIPEGSVLISSEEQMRPVLQEAAERHRTTFHSVNWLQAGLLTEDVLARFPYEEHPYNIALVQRMAEHLGIDANFALKEMADRVVPDLGVLKAYPMVSLWGRQLEYINGMSANERLACLGNWRRMGFDQHDPDREPQIWLSTVINNRADRIPRSQVFAAILANDISADRHYLIGTNLDGFLNYLHEAWERRVARSSLWQQADEPPVQVQQRWQAEAQRLRQPTDLSGVERRLQAMVDGLAGSSQPLPQAWREPRILQAWLAQPATTQWSEAIQAQLQRDLTGLEAYEALCRQIKGADSPSARHAVDQRAKSLQWQWLRDRIQVIEDPKVSGNQVIRIIAENSPPGLLTRIMGMQNIKGAGLDFAYRWQSWEICHRLCEQLNQPDAVKVSEAAKQLAAFQDFGWLGAEMVPMALQQARDSVAAQTETVQAELNLIEENQRRVLEKLVQQGVSGHRSALYETLVGWVEAFLDAGDGIRRRKQAQQIYMDLATQRISHGRAVIALEALNRRQKGGWLGAFKGDQGGDVK